MKRYQVVVGNNDEKRFVATYETNLVDYACGFGCSVFLF